MSYTPSKDVLNRNVQSFELGDDVQEVSQVIINYGTSSSGATLSQVYPATPTVTGRIVELTLQTITDSTVAYNIAQSIYTKYHTNNSHEVFTTTGTELSPLMELGDGVAVNYTSYSDIGNLTIDFSKAMYVAIESQGVPDDDDDFPYLSNLTDKTERDLQTLKTSLTVQAGQIKSEITARTDADEELQSSIDQRLDSITLSVSGTSGTTTFQLKDGSTVLDTETFDLHVSSVNVEGTITADYVEASGVGTGTLNLGDSSTYGGIVFAYSGGSNAKIYTDSSATLAVVNNLGGFSVSAISQIYMNTASNVSINSSGTMSLNSSSTLYLYGGSSSSVMVRGSSMVPYSDGACGLGYSNYRWGQIYSTSSTILTSDRNEKKDINYNIDDMDSFFDSIKPCSYKFIYGNSGRTHYGMISQDVEDSLTSHGKTALEFAGFCKDVKTEQVIGEDGSITDVDTGEYRYGIRYEEFIALCISQIQKLKVRVAELEANIN